MEHDKYLITLSSGEKQEGNLDMPESSQQLDLEKLYQEIYRTGLRPQTAVGPGWNTAHATWFTAMGVGGGLYLYRLVLGLNLGTFLGLPLIDLLSIIIVGIGGGILIADLGHPERLLKAIANVKTSWIARGAVADFLFMGFGILAIAPHFEIGNGFKPFSFLPWTINSQVGLVIQLIAWVTAIIVMIYVGLVLYGSHSVPFWRTSTVPILLPLSSLSAALGLVFVVASFTGLTGVSLKTVEALQAALVTLTLVFAFIQVSYASKNGDSAKESASLLRKGRYATLFMGGALVAGLVLPLVLIAFAYMVSGVAETSALAFSGILVIIGTFLLRLSLLKAAYFSPPNYHGLRVSSKIP